MRRALSIVAFLLILQACFVLMYRSSQGGHEDEAVGVEHVSWPAPELRYRSREGTLGRLSQYRGQFVLVHFWATWCAPCREELPGLLAWAEDSEIPTLALSLDADWGRVEDFLQQAVPASVVMAESTRAAEDFAVHVLPETLLVDPSGRVVLRVAGARDWSSRVLRESVAAEARQSAARPHSDLP